MSQNRLRVICANFWQARTIRCFGERSLPTWLGVVAVRMVGTTTIARVRRSVRDTAAPRVAVWWVVGPAIRGAVVGRRQR